jgi:hypothetical protein
MRRVTWLFSTLVAACGGGTAESPDSAGPDVADSTTPDGPFVPLEFDCQPDASCPELTIIGDPLSPSSFSGLGDPSLERDTDGTLWLSYSWLEEDTLPGNPEQLHAVATHLARSTDGGASFEFVRAVNAAAPSPGNVGLVMHEVSTLARTPDGWEDLWLTYALIPTDTRVEFHYQHTIAATPEGLGTVIEPYLKGSNGTVPTQLVGTAIAGLENCAVFTEPALFAHEGTTYLATTCIVQAGNPSTQRLVLLRRSGTSLVLVGDLLSFADAQDLGGTRVEQIDLSIGRDDSILAIVTPILDGSPQPHRGCVVLEIDDLATAHMRRDADGKLFRRATLTGSTLGIGPGLCTYDRDSSTGILMDLTITSPILAFSLRATGVHP